MKTRIAKSLSGAIAAALLLALPAIGEAQTRVKPGFNMFSPQQDAQIGYNSAAQVERQMRIVRDPAVTAYVDGIGQRLARYAPGPQFQYRFRVIDSPEMNAFALPGGYIYLNRGVIENAQNEGEVAGVLAHEIAHVALRHGTENASKGQLTQAGAGLVGALLGRKMSRNTAQIVNVAGGVGMQALFLKYGREAETEADIVATQMMSRSGRYSPADLVSFFQKIERGNRRQVAQWMSSHPAPARRVQRIEQEARLIGAPMRRSTRTSELRRVQARLG
jgi:predicted Zn-dependent protease